MSSPSDTLEHQLIYAPNVLHNSSVQNIKFISAGFTGAVAGILGLEKWLGFVLFLASIILTTALIVTVNCKGKPSRYIPGGLLTIVNPGQDNAFTFVLTWTLFYGLVHVYD
ncbi:hypothetical protein DL96DRAFT_1707629 [Flagelloscypha sp. PMI_526]|nr:hypothetical protein DL96DRAFT_1707629 [Flagelloscypha sp. PMI_526]